MDYLAGNVQLVIAIFDNYKHNYNYNYKHNYYRYLLLHIRRSRSLTTRLYVIINELELFN